MVNYIRKFLRATIKEKVKVGHAGTLDPLATGLLLICTGKFTKKINEFVEFDKEYMGTFFLGATTPSFDSESEIDEHFNTSHITPELIEEKRKLFLGKIQQVPPKFSAIKIDGKPAYLYARKNRDVKMQSREVEISTFEINRMELPELYFRVECSKGTYIRSLAYDYGKALNSGGYLTSLCRTRIGPFLLDDAMSIEDFRDTIIPK